MTTGLIRAATKQHAYWLILCLGPYPFPIRIAQGGPSTLLTSWQTRRPGRLVRGAALLHNAAADGGAHSSTWQPLLPATPSGRTAGGQPGRESRHAARRAPGAAH